MSIYSGFATRFQQQTYDHAIETLLFILQKRIIKFYTQQPSDEPKFISLLLKIYHQMKRMQQSKYLEPKISQSISELVGFMLRQQERWAWEDNEKKKCLVGAKGAQVVFDQVLRGEQAVQKIKKHPLWLERQQQIEEQVRNVSQQSVQTIGTFKFNSNNEVSLNSSHGPIAQFKKSSQAHLATQNRLLKKHIERFSSKGEGNMMESSGVSGNEVGQQKGGVNILSLKGREGSGVISRKRRIRSSLKPSQLANTTSKPYDEVVDIIKEYINKSKKSGVRNCLKVQAQFGRSEHCF